MGSGLRLPADRLRGQSSIVPELLLRTDMESQQLLVKTGLCHSGIVVYAMRRLLVVSLAAFWQETKAFCEISRTRKISHNGTSGDLHDYGARRGPRYL